MKNEKIVKLFRNREFIDKLSKCETIENKVDLLNKNGVLISLDEYKRVEQIVKETKAKIISEIPDYELENVAGGVDYGYRDAGLICQAMLQVLKAANSFAANGKMPQSPCNEINGQVKNPSSQINNPQVKNGQIKNSNVKNCSNKKKQKNF